MDHPWRRVQQSVPIDAACELIRQARAGLQAGKFEMKRNIAHMTSSSSKQTKLTRRLRESFEFLFVLPLPRFRFRVFGVKNFFSLIKYRRKNIQDDNKFFFFSISYYDTFFSFSKPRRSKASTEEETRGRFWMETYMTCSSSNCVSVDLSSSLATTGFNWALERCDQVRRGLSRGLYN